MRVFSDAGQMRASREGHTATLLHDGRVLIAGGHTGRPDGTLSSAELYDPATGTFAATGNMTTPRVFHTAMLLDDGRVLIIGGIYSAPGSGELGTAELFDPRPARSQRPGRECMLGDAPRPFCSPVATC